jgi:hypothetical protein
MRLHIDNGMQWHFTNAAWIDTPDGPSVPEDAVRTDGPAMQGHHYAVCSDGSSYDDFDAEFSFQLTPHSDVGLIFHARSLSEFYVLHFPDCGQASRGEHFWAAVSHMDSSGWMRIVKMELVRRVSSTQRDWHHAAVSLRDGTLQAVIDGIGRFDVSNERLRGAGSMGLYSFGIAGIQDIEITSKPSNGAVESTPSPVKTWFHPCPENRHGKWQKPGSVVRTPGGDVVIYFGAQEQAYSGETVALSVRSVDEGCTFSDQIPVEGIPSGYTSSSVAHIFPDGAMRLLCTSDDGFALLESDDDGRSWVRTVPMGTGSVPTGLPKLHPPPAPFVNLSDGSMIMYGYGSHESSLSAASIQTWGSHHCTAFAARSTDCGKTWTNWESIDGTSESTGSFDLTETCGIQVANGKVCALTRPIYSPWMWESWFNPATATWSPCVRGAFPGYACSNMVRTHNGTLLMAHRLPGCTIHASHDDGTTWDNGQMVDSAIWVMGSMLEVTPDRVLYVYWDSYESLMRAQFIEVRDDSIHPTM